MSALFGHGPDKAWERSMRARCLFRCRLRGPQFRAGRNQARQLMRGGRA